MKHGTLIALGLAAGLLLIEAASLTGLCPPLRQLFLHGPGDASRWAILGGLLLVPATAWRATAGSRRRLYLWAVLLPLTLFSVEAALAFVGGVLPGTRTASFYGAESLLFHSPWGAGTLPAAVAGALRLWPLLAAAWVFLLERDGEDTAPLQGFLLALAVASVALGALAPLSPPRVALGIDFATRVPSVEELRLLALHARAWPRSSPLPFEPAALALLVLLPRRPSSRLRGVAALLAAAAVWAAVSQGRVWGLTALLSAAAAFACAQWARRAAPQKPALAPPPPPRPRADRWLPPLLAGLFAASGFAGVAYEVLFSKRLALTFGSTADATSLVLALYMGGSALGAWLGGWLIARHVSGRRLYALCELGVGLYCWNALRLLRGLESLYGQLDAGHAASPSFPLRAAICLAVVMPPTVLMGMTLPALARALEERGRSLGDATGVLYWANTLGAALGALLTGYWLIPALGLSSAVRIAVLVSLTAGLGALLLRAGSGASAAASPVAQAPLCDPEPRTLGAVALAILAVGGAVTFGLEVVDTHLLAAAAGNSAFAFSLMVFAFLLGLSLGSALVRPRLRAQRPLLPMLAACELGLCATIFLSARAWPSLALWFGQYFGWAPTASFGAREIVRALCCLAVLLPPAVFIGALFPLAIEALLRARLFDHQRTVGLSAAVNTVGNVSGALLCGFFLLPRAGSNLSLWVLGGTCAGLGLAALWADPRRRTPRLLLATLLLGVLLATQPRQFDWRGVTAGTNVYFAPPRWGPPIDLLESLNGGITSVHAGGREPGQPPNFTLLTNGKYQGDSLLIREGEVTAQTGFALVPLLHAGGRRQALNIGFGTGNTARVLRDEGFSRIDVVDLSADVLTLADRWFGTVNDGVLHSPQTRVVVADGRNFALLSRDSYDLISIEITSIWFAGAAALYNQEFYRLLRARLADGGVLQQWVQLHHLTEPAFATLLATLRAEFPVIYLYRTGGQGVLVACPRACPVLPAPQLAALRTPQLASFFDAIGMRPELLTRTLMLDPAGVDRYLADATRRQGPITLSTDDNLKLEYETPKGNALRQEETARLLSDIRRGSLQR